VLGDRKPEGVSGGDLRPIPLDVGPCNGVGTLVGFVLKVKLVVQGTNRQRISIITNGPVTLQSFWFSS